MNNHKLLEGNPPSKRVLAQIKKNIKEKKLSICLAIILIGDNSASKKYIEMKMAACKEVGIKTKFLDYTEFNEEEIIKKIKKLNEDKKITGILIQLPLLKELDTEKIINTIDPKKDVDGLTKINERNLESGKETLAPATPKGILKLLEGYGIKLENKKIVLVGMGKLVGYPLSIMLKNRKLNFTACDEFTENTKEKVKEADILITATGIPHLIKEDWVKQGSIVVDVGYSKLNGKVVGDVDFENVKNKTSFITPIFGGVGPMTIATLIENLYNIKNNLI